MERNKLIDGWRGLSVVLVIVGHAFADRFFHLMSPVSFSAILHEKNFNFLKMIENIFYRSIQQIHVFGVNFFFLISGFLITSLLLKEESLNGTISLKAFYVRRTFRIIPAFYFYLATVFLLLKIGEIQVPDGSILWSGMFLYIFPWPQYSWWVHHTWSLSVEELYYVVWPLLFLLLKRSWRVVALFVIIFLLEALAFFDPITNSFAFIAVGALYAASSGLREFFFQKVGSKSIVAACVILILIQFVTANRFLMGTYSLASPWLFAIILFGTISERGPMVRIVSWGLLQKIGLISYSLYLWQAISLAPINEYLENSLLFIPILFVFPAIISYFVIEKPLIRIGHRISSKILAAPKRFE